MLWGEPQCRKGNRCNASQICVSTTMTRQPAPSSWRKEDTAFPLKNETSDQANSVPTGTDAMSALSNVTVILITGGIPFVRTVDSPPHVTPHAWGTLL